MSRILLIFFLLLSTTNALAREDPKDAFQQTTVTVSIAPQKYILQRIAGNANLQVVVLVRPGADPHSYEPSPAQVRDIETSLAWFTIGVPFEDIWLPRIQKIVPQLKIISSIKGIKRLRSDESEHVHNEHEHHEHAEEADTQEFNHDHSHGGEDPHVWLSPMLVREMLPGLAKELGRLFPDKAAEFKANAATFGNELESLDKELAARFDAFPAEQRVFLTFHPSWRYFAYNYQLTELSIEIDGKEPGPRTLQAVLNKAQHSGIRTVFVEPQFSKSAATAIAEAIGAKVETADPLAEDLVVLYNEMTDKLVRSFNR